MRQIAGILDLIRHVRKIPVVIIQLFLGNNKFIKKYRFRTVALCVSHVSVCYAFIHMQCVFALVNKAKLDKRIVLLADFEFIG